MPRPFFYRQRQTGSSGYQAKRIIGILGHRQIVIDIVILNPRMQVSRGGYPNVGRCSGKRP